MELSHLQIGSRFGTLGQLAADSSEMGQRFVGRGSENRKPANNAKHIGKRRVRTKTDRGGWRILAINGTYVNLKILVKLVVHNQGMGKSYSMRFHGMACRIGVVADISIVKVGHRLLLLSILGGSIQGSKSGHIGGA